MQFLRLRHVPLTEADAEADLPELGAATRTETEGDRDVMEKATRAFVSWVLTVYPGLHPIKLSRLSTVDANGLKNLCGQ